MRDAVRAWIEVVDLRAERRQRGLQPQKKPVVMCDFRAASPRAPAHIQFLQYRPLIPAVPSADGR
jgi:hypothetical protein